jgi:hypothetical protein
LKQAELPVFLILSLRKTTKLGFNGSVIGTLGYLPRPTLIPNLSWRKGNLTVFLNGGGGYRESKIQTEILLIISDGETGDLSIRYSNAIKTKIQ